MSDIYLNGPTIEPPHAVVVTLVTGRTVSFNELKAFNLSPAGTAIIMDHGNGNRTIIPLTSIVVAQVQQEKPSGIVPASTIAKP